MAYEIVFTDTARMQHKRLDARRQTSVKAAIECHLRHEPAKISKSRIKRLRELDHPQFRLRVDDCRVYYDIEAQTVVVLAILLKDETETWLLHYGVKSS